MWDYFLTPGPTVDGTTLYCASPTAKYMDWIWQIPIRNGLLSVGYVSTGETIKQQRQSGLDVPQIYEARLREFPALGSLLTAAEQIAPRVTSFRCRVHKKVSGPNWLIVGEAASMVDPMTSNGVTAALRHAQEAAALLIRSRNASRLPRMAAAAYAWRVNDVSAFFNSLIEKIIYEASIRARIGALVAGDMYTIPAWLMNLFSHSRIRPKGVITTACFGMVLGFLRCTVAIFSRVSAALARPVRRPIDKPWLLAAGRQQAGFLPAGTPYLQRDLCLFHGSGVVLHDRAAGAQQPSVLTTDCRIPISCAKVYHCG